MRARGQIRRAARRATDAALLRPRHVALGAAVAGLVAGPRAPGLALAGAVLLLSTGAATRRVGLGLCAACAILAGAVVADARLRSERPAARAELGQPVDVRADVLEAPRRHAFGGWSAAARVRDGALRGRRVVLRASERTPRPAVGVGDEVRVRGRVAPLAPWEGYEEIRGARAALVLDSAAATGRRRGGLAGIVDGARRRAESALEAGLPAPQAALARGMVLGQDDALEDRTRSDFRASGLSHLLAASGQNVALLALLATGALALLGVGWRGRMTGALVLVALYVPLAGGGPSILRAGVMGGAALVAGLAGRPGSRLYALLLAAAVTLVAEPRAIADVGWQLSFAAVVAIALLAPRWREGLLRRGVPAPVAETVALTAAATAGTAPLLAAHFERLSVVSPLANLVAAPAVAPVVWLGTLAALAAQLPALGAPLAAPAGVLVTALDTVAAFPLGFVGWVAHAAASAPHATVAVALAGPAALAGAYAGMAALAFSRRARALALGGMAAGALALAWHRAHPPLPPRALTVSFLDVGQGDATLVQQGARAILVDTGPPDGPIVRRLRAAGVRRLDLLVLTHAQADHEGAAAAILAALPVSAVLDGGADSRSAGRAPIEAALRARHVERLYPDAGEVLRDGPLRLDVLWPHRPQAIAAAAAGADPNDTAIVARLREGAFDLLLTADAESPVTLPIAPDGVDVLKVAHHGSADPGLPALLERLHPRLAVIEVGRHNSYGHPSPSALRALHAVPEVLRTDHDGTVRLTVSGDRMTVMTHA